MMRLTCTLDLYMCLALAYDDSSPCRGSSPELKALLSPSAAVLASAHALQLQLVRTLLVYTTYYVCTWLLTAVFPRQQIDDA